MRLLWPSLILVASSAFTGCHARQAADPVADAEPPAATSAPAAVQSPHADQDGRPLLVCFGDSLTAGHGTDPGESYPDYLQRDLDNAGYAYRVVNEGISGNTTKDGLDRVDRVVALHPAIVVVEFGGNDGLRGLRIEDTRANLDAILGRLKASGAKIVLAGITLPPDYGPDYIKQFQITYALMARKYAIPFLPFLLQGVFGVDGMMQDDRTHATARGNQIVAENVLHLVAPLLTKQASRRS